ncbi:MAG: bifunctional diaminohydroxyphosphoribosylaminopyrimidine deaminase/5-amino-6-(5-phosphoribosylamino)uracil reductase RibD [Immundisolibacterales bacterium]|nr:bifunctional diaminohydroxyphosphoribosylaminopyrimidine deaminase/5-amino-6-(5-phosphoribosylamino)uracil reductase RibD [Immundisolibacterales bacterium]
MKPGREYMERALDLARRGMFTAHPNPRVGCVLVRDGAVVGEGWHRAAGEAHAEVLALAAAGPRARGATAYVTLEPCCHQGRTPPCTDALVAAGVARVVAAARDPDPRVAGSGIERLRAAGIDAGITDAAPIARAAAELNAGFFLRVGAGRPFVRLKLAASLDARTALPDGSSRWITGDEARRDVQRWRARAGALLTGVGTVLADDPRLTIRPSELALTDTGAGVEAPPDPHRLLRVVLDSRLRTPPASALFCDPAPVLLATRRSAVENGRAQALRAAGAEVEALEADRADDLTPGRDEGGRAGGIDPGAVLRALAKREVNEVHVECGPTLAGALVGGGFVDELLLYLAPTLLGSGSKPLLGLAPPPDMASRIELRILETKPVGGDLRVRAAVGGTPSLC